MNKVINDLSRVIRGFGFFGFDILKFTVISFMDLKCFDMLLPHGIELYILLNPFGGQRLYRQHNPEKPRPKSVNSHFCVICTLEFVFINGLLRLFFVHKQVKLSCKTM